jgi:phage-related protein
LAAAGGGLTIFGLIGGAAIAKTNKVAKQIADLRKKANTLVDPKAAAAAKAQAEALEATLTGPQKAFLAAKDAVGEAFETLTKSSGKDIFRPINQGLKLLAAVMPALAPVIHSVSDALTDLLQSAGKSAKGGGLKSFLDFLARASGPAITAFATILGNIGTGVAGLITAFAPVGAKLTDKLIELTGAFADFGRNADSNSGLQSFIAYVQEVGPRVAEVLGSVIQAVVHLAVALAPFGGIVLGGIGLLANLISAIPTPVLTVLASVIGTVVVGLKAWAVAQAIIDALLVANPIGLVVLAIAGLVTGLVLAYKSSQTFRDVVKGVFKVVSTAASAMWTVIKAIFKTWVTVWFTVVGAIVNGAAKAFGWVPGIGGKLKAAAEKFNEFRDSVNRALDGIHPEKTIRLNVTTKQIVLNPSLAKPRGIDGERASGGPVVAGRTYLVGEEGPELWTAPSSGRIIPNSELRIAQHTPPETGQGDRAGVDYEQALYRGMGRALADNGFSIVPNTAIDLGLLGVA